MYMHIYRGPHVDCSRLRRAYAFGGCHCALGHAAISFLRRARRAATTALTTWGTQGEGAYAYLLKVMSCYRRVSPQRINSNKQAQRVHAP